MHLSKEDLKRLCFLLGKQRHDGLLDEEKKELTELVLIESPDFDLIPFENIIKFGFVIVGIHTVFEEFEKELSNGKKEIR